MLAMSTFSEKSWNSSEDYDDDNSSTSSTVNRRINNGEMVEVNGNNVITTHCVSTVIKPGDKQLHDPLQFVKIKSTELSQKAKEQIKLAEEVKITKEKIKEVEEEWQNNLLSWKSKRRQSKRSSEEELEDNNSINNSRKIKTFNEILNEKAKSGHRIGYNLHQYLNEEDNDLIIDQSSFKSYSTDDSTNLNFLNEKEQVNNSNNKFSDHASNNFLSYSQTDSKCFSNEIQPEHENDQIDDSVGVVINTNLLKEYSSNNLSHSKENEINDQSNNLSYEDENQLQNNNLNITNNKNETKNNFEFLNKNNSNFNDESKKKNFLKNEAFSSNKSSTSDSIKKNENLFSAYNKTKEIKKVDVNDLNETNTNVDNQNLKLSFKAKLSAFESLAKNEIKKPDVIKTPPVKNKLRMSSSNNLITDCKSLVDENKNLMPKNNDGFSKRFTSKSNENLSKTFKNTQETHHKNDENSRIDFNSKNSSRSEYKLTKSESNLMTNKVHFNDHTNDITKSDQSLPIKNCNLVEKNSNKPSNKINQVMNNIDYSNKNNFDCENDINELSQLMQQQVINNDSNQLNTPPISQEIDQYSQYIKNLNDTNNTKTLNYFNDDYANSAITNQNQVHDIHQMPLNHLMNNTQQTQNLYNQQVSNESILRDATNQFINSNVQSHSMFNPAITKQSMSTSMLTQPGYYEDNYSSNIYGNYYSNNSIPNNYQFQKDNRSTSSSHLEYASNGLPVTNQAYYQEKNSVPFKTSLGNANNLSQVPYSNFSVNRHSQPQLNNINTNNQQSISSNQPANQQQAAYNYNHWLIQEAELRRQIATRNGNSLITNTVNTAKNQKLINSKNNNCHLGLINNGISSENVYKDDQPVYENTIIYNSHKKQQQLQHNFSNSLASQYLGQQQVSKPPYPNPSPVSNNQTEDQKSSLHVDNDITSMNDTSSQQYFNQQQKQQKQLLSVSGKKKCSNCGDELGRGCAAMVIETLSLYYHINCFRCSVCHIILGNGTSGTDVRVRNYKLNCQNCYSNDEGIFY